MELMRLMGAEKYGWDHLIILIFVRFFENLIREFHLCFQCMNMR